MKVLGVSVSPIRNNNTDRALKAALDATGMESVGIHRFEDQPDAMDAASELGKKIAAAVRTRRM
jgi:hypothetical protein